MSKLDQFKDKFEIKFISQDYDTTNIEITNNNKTYQLIISNFTILCNIEDIIVDYIKSIQTQNREDIINTLL
jgi:hypothetical protein